MKRVKSVLAIGLISAQVGAFMPHAWAEFESNVFYVSAQSGSDYFSGSREKPFRTISKAANVMKAGDKCYIAEGVYRETVNMNIYGTKENPVTFEAYNGGKVVISAADEISGWEKYNGNIYRAKMDWDYKSGNGNMLFSDGEQCFEARWPNTSDLLGYDSYAKVQSVNKTAVSITNSELPDIDYTGAVVWYNTEAGYWSKTSTVTGYNKSTKTISFKTSSDATTYVPQTGSIFYVTRALGLLDSPKEWFKDSKTGYIYFGTDGKTDPNNLCIEAKKRENAIVMDNSRYVNVKGITVRGGNIKTGENTNNCTWDNMVIESVDYNISGGNSANPDAASFVIYGENNTLKNSEIKNCYGDGVVVDGRCNSVVNNYIHDVNFEHTYSYGICVKGENQFINHNTVSKMGRSALGGDFRASEISYNDFYDTMRLSIDGGVIYLVNNDYDSSEIHHNLIHDNSGKEGYQSGIYYDSNTNDVITYNNVVWNIEKGLEKAKFMTLNTPSANNIFFNNTFINDSQVNIYPSNGSVEGAVFLNNIFKQEGLPEETIKEKNINYSNNVIVSMNDLNDDFTPKNSANIVNKGINISGITDRTEDGSPDMGAYEYGEVKWSAGKQNGEVTDSFGLHYTIPFKNAVKNRSFEDGLTGWKTENGNPELINLSSWNFSRLYTNNGMYGLTLKNTDGVSQEITGLKPYTEYNIGAFAKICGEFYAAGKAVLKSKNNFISGNYRASGIVGNISGGDWIGYKNVDFKDGSCDIMRILTNTTQSGGKIEVYIDSLDGDKILEHSYKTTSKGSWNDNECKINASVKGVHDVYFKFTGTQQDAFFGGFELYNSLSKDTVELCAVSDRGDFGKIEYSEKAWQINPEKISVTTGNIGEIEIFISKKSGDNVGYIDGVSVTETINTNTVDFIIDGIKILNADREMAKILGDSSVNILEFCAMNFSPSDKSYTFTAVGYDCENNVSGESKITETIKSGGKLNAGLGVKVPQTEGAYIKLAAFADGKKLDEYKITNVFCERETADNCSVRRVWVTNGTGVQDIVSEESSKVSIMAENRGTADENADFMLALYTADGRLCGVKKATGIVGTGKINIISIEVENTGDYSYGKLMVWRNGELTPLTEAFSL